MKKLIYLIAFGIFAMFSCESHINEIDDPVTESSEVSAVYQKVASSSNPDLYTNWENVKTIYLNGGNGLVTAPPWVYHAAGNNNIPETYGLDIKKEDGWKLILHNIDNVNEDKGNYMLFYNRKRGILKGFYYHLAYTSTQNFIWEMAASSPSTVIPSNYIINGGYNKLSQFATSSNIIKTGNEAKFAYLDHGWNAFIFELPYGAQHNSPTIELTGYDSKNSTIQLAGKYSGEVVIPFPQTESSSGGILKKVGDFLKDVVGVLIPGSESVTNVISQAGTALGKADAFVKADGKTTYINVTAKSKGTMDLTGLATELSGGQVTRAIKINLKECNDNEELGLWSLNGIPNYKYNEIVFADGPYYQAENPYEESHFWAFPQLSPASSLENMIVINPKIRQEIKSYKVISSKFIVNKSWMNLKYNERAHTGIKFDKLMEDWYTTKFEKAVRGVIGPMSPNYGYYFFSRIILPSNCYVNLTVEFEYKDGSKFYSSRNFNATISSYSDYTQYNRMKSLPYAKVYLYQ